MLLLSGAGLIIAANRATAERLSLVLRGKALADVVADPPDEVARYLRHCRRSRSLVLGALLLRGKDGGRIACRAEGVRVYPAAAGAEAVLMLRLIPKESATGKFIALNQRIEELGREIQRRRHAEEAVRRQEERLRVTLRSIGDAVVVTDPDGRVVMLNPVAESLTGWTHGEALGHPLETVFHIINENTRKAVESPTLRALRDGTATGLANHTVLVAKNGTERPIDDCAAPIRDERGQAIGAVLVFRDVTDKRAAESALRASERRWRTLAETLPNLLWTDTPDGRCDWLSSQWRRYTGIPEQELLGLRWLETVIHPDDRSRTLECWQAACADRGPYDLEYRIRRYDGEYRWFKTRGVPVRDEHGKIIYWFGTCTDIEDVKRMEAALREDARRKNEFLATLAHELRNPLAPLRTGLQVLRLAKDPAAQEEARAMMERQLGQMVRLIDDLLDIGRISRNKLELRKARIPLAAVVENAVETARPLLDAKGHTLTVTLPPEPVFLDADLTRLAQVFWNLLNNAAKYTDPGGRVELSARRDGAEVVVTVRDTGIGIPAEALPDLFRLFSQVDNSLERSQGGLGIGLALVKGLVEMHGGTVAVSSAGVGQGSEFLVRLPVAPAEGEAPTPTTAERTSGPARRRVLVVDDNRDGAASLGMMLSLLGHDTRTAHDGLQALELAGAFRPDVILLDIGLPRLNGYEAARRLRAQPWGREVLLVAVTGWGQEEDKRRALEAGFDFHLVKPVEPAALAKLLAGPG